MNFANKTALLFDLDGTLVDSVPDLALAVNQTLTTLGLDTFTQEQIRNWVGNGAQVLIERALSGSKDIDPKLNNEHKAQAVTLFLDAYKENNCINTCTYPDVVSTLKALKQRGFTLAVITNKPVEFVAPILDKMGLNDLFELILGGDSLTKRKPDPLPLNYACQQLNVSVEQCIMIGDSKNDILAAKAANMQSIGLTYGYNYDEPISVYQPDLMLNDFNQLLKYIG